MNQYFLATFISFLFWSSVGLIIYTYFGYPVLIACLSSLKKTSAKTEISDYAPKTTLLIAAYNEKDFIEEKIKNSFEINYPKDKLQILIVTDGSSDGTPNIVRSYEKLGIQLFHEDKRSGKMAAINRVMQFATGEIVVFSDANNIYQADTIQKLVEPFADPKVGAVSGSKTIEKGDGELGNSEGLYWKYESFIKKHESRFSSCTSVAGEILAVRKNVFINPPDDIVADDFFTAMNTLRQGYRLVYAEDAKSKERISISAKDEIVRRKKINAGRYQSISKSAEILPRNIILIWQIVSHKFLRLFVPFFMISAFLLNIIAVVLPYQKPTNWLFLSSPIGEIILALQVLFYVLAFIGTFIGKQQGNSKLRLLFYLPTFLVNSNYAALQGFLQFIKRKPSHLWEKANRR